MSNNPLDPQPERRSLLESIRFYLALAVSRRNRREARQAQAAEENAPYRAAEARRRAAQPGAEDARSADDLVAKATRVMGRIGRGAR